MSDAEDRVSSGRSWAEFCDALKQAGEQIQRADAPSDPFTRAEGYRYLSRLARAGLEWYVEFNDPAFPVLYKPSHETIKIGADNPDNIYEKAVVDGRHDYRIRGKRGSVYYISMATSKGSYAENFKQVETGFLDINDVEIAADGSSFAPHLMENGTAGYRADRADGSFALASGGRWLDGRSPTYDLEWEAAIGVPDPGSGAGAWIHDAAALADGSIVVVGDYEGTVTFGAGEPCETTLEPACDDCWYSAFVARYAW